MLKIRPSNRFKRDVSVRRKPPKWRFSPTANSDLKLLATRGLDLSLLDDAVSKLADRQPLETKNKDHALTGDYVGFRECHIQPDWLLIYRIDDDELFLSRTGSHSDLF